MYVQVGDKVPCWFKTARSTITRTVTVTAVHADGSFAGVIRVSGRTIAYPIITPDRLMNQAHQGRTI